MINIEKELKVLNTEKMVPEEGLRIHTRQEMRRAARHTRQAKKSLFRLLPAAASILLAVLLLFGAFPRIVGNEDGDISYVSIDINPSIRLILQDGIVTDATAFNDDGSDIIIATSVVNMTAEQAIESLINEFSVQGYLVPGSTDAALVITVSGDNENAMMTSLELKAQESLALLGLQCNLVTQTIQDEVTDEAAALGLSAGRYMLLKYLAKQENITMQAAIEKYGTMKMGKLLEIIGSPDLAFEDLRIEDLTPEQREQIKQAHDAYKAAMKAAHKQLVAVKNTAQKQFRDLKKAEQDNFKGNKNHETWEEVKARLQNEFKVAQEAAFAAFRQAKELAQKQFMAAIEGINLRDDIIADYLAYDLNLDWDFDFEWPEAPTLSPSATPEGKGKGKNN